MLRGLSMDDFVAIVVPPVLAEALPLLRAEIGEFESALGARVRFTGQDPGSGPRWLMGLAPVDHPRLDWDEAQRTLRSSAADAAGLFATLNLLHTVVRSGGASALDAPTADRDMLVDVVEREITGSFPRPAHRGVDWPAICARHEPLVRGAADPLPALQRWMAELGDVHTSAHRSGPVWHPPYAVRIDRDQALIVRVPVDSPAYRAGVRTGWYLVEPDIGRWRERTGAPGHARSLLAGRRMIELPGAIPRPFQAKSPNGRTVGWTETPRPATTVEHRRLDRTHGYLRVAAWMDPLQTDQSIDAAFAELADCPHLVVDLRGNTGGELILAQRTRDRFLRAPTVLGGIRYSTGDGRLGRRYPLEGRPPQDAPCWLGDAVILTDALTCSASEDFVLGLHGLPHIRTAGEPSCGGSGRPRSVRLTSDIGLSISTALTDDRDGRGVEGNGLPVDLPGPAFDGDTPLHADSLVALAVR